jgi:hypothetical protein
MTPALTISNGTIAEGKRGSRNGVEENWPKPLEKDAYHGVAGTLVHAIAPSTESDDVAILLQFLAAFGNLCGRNAYYAVEGDKHPAMIWPIIVGPTAKARKGTSWSRVRELMNLVAPKWVSGNIVSGLSSGEGLVYEVRDPSDTVNSEGEPTEPGVEDKLRLVLETEFVSTFRQFERSGNTLSSALRALWDTGCCRSLTKNSRTATSNSMITIVGHITQEELLRYLTKTECANGLANRFLWALVRRSKVLPFGGDDIDFEPFTEPLTKAIDRALSSNRRIGWTNDGRSLWANVYKDLSEGKPGLLGKITSRSETQVARLALTYALLDGVDKIDVPHLKAAIAVWRYCEESVRIIFAGRTGNDLADKILTFLKKAEPEGMSRQEINEALKGHKSSIDISDALNALADGDLARVEQINTGGRPQER